MTEPAGILPVDKPVGPTSHDVVAAARRALGTRRVGHSGTLDPFASGLLLLCVGQATRIVEYLSDLPKTYRATMRLGAATDTDDRTGETIATSETWRHIDPGAIEQALRSRIGTSEQIPPSFSAKKVGGERLYRAARQGREVTARPAQVTVHALSIVNVVLPDVTFEITCGPGFYVRAIARDVGSELGTWAHLVELRRTRIGPHDVSAAVALADLADEVRVAAAWIEPLEALAHLPRLEVGPDEAHAVGHGRAFAAPAGAQPGTAAVAHEGRLIAVALVGHGEVRPRKVFAA